MIRLSRHADEAMTAHSRGQVITMDFACLTGESQVPFALPTNQNANRHPIALVFQQLAQPLFSPVTGPPPLFIRC